MAKLWRVDLLITDEQLGLLLNAIKYNTESFSVPRPNDSRKLRRLENLIRSKIIKHSK